MTQAKERVVHSIRVGKALAEIERLKTQAARLEAELTTVSEDLVTLDEAAEIAGRSYRTIERWVAAEILPKAGRERFHARNGGRVLVERQKVEELRDNPPRPGPR